MPKLGVVLASTREGRVCLPVAEWFLGLARQHGQFDVSAIDLKELDLPLLAEPNHPRQQKYTQDKTKAWSAQVASLDAFVFVTPEYNYSSPPALINALDHLYLEWNYKPAGFVSYGGISGGMRSVQMTKQLLTTLKIVPLVEAVAISLVSQLIDAGSGRFKSGESHDKAARVMLDELMRWTGALKALRA